MELSGVVQIPILRIAAVQAGARYHVPDADEPKWRTLCGKIGSPVASHARTDICPTIGRIEEIFSI